MTKKILLVDDERIVIKSITALLEKEGYQVESAGCAEEAMAKIKSNAFSLLICDIRLLGKNGIELVKEIRGYLESAGKPLIPEILITGYANIDCYQEASGLRVSAYIYKPFDNYDLILAVKKALKTG